MIRWSKKLQQLEKNNYVVLINYEDGGWVRISKDTFDDCNKYLIGTERAAAPYEKLSKELMSYKMINDEKSSFSQPRSKNLYLFTTLKCNMACDFCCVEASPDKKCDFLSKDHIDKIVGKIGEANIHKVILTGGEPLMYEHIAYLIKQLKEKGNCGIQLCTNGLLLTTEAMKMIEGVESIDISVENLFLETEVYQELEILKNKIMHLKERDIRITLSYVVTNYNYLHINRFIDFCYDNQVEISVKIVSSAGRAKENKNILLSGQQVKKIMLDYYKYVYENKLFNDLTEIFLFPRSMPEKMCAASGKIYSLHPDGSMYSCFMLSEPRFYLGNLLQSSFWQIEKNIETKKTSGLYKKSFDKDYKNKCKDCEIRYFCEGNCCAVGDPQEGQCITCEFHKEYYGFLIWHYSKHSSFEENLKALIQYLDPGYKCNNNVKQIVAEERSQFDLKG